MNRLKRIASQIHIYKAGIYISVFLLICILFSCRTEIDKQPPQSSAVVKSVDTVTVIPIESFPSDTVLADTPTKTEVIVIDEPEQPHEVAKDSLLSRIYLSYVGVKEATGKNDGPEVKKFLNACGLEEGFAWCSCFVKSCFDEAGITTPITAWSPTAENKNNYVLKSGSWKQELRKGDVFTLYFPKLKRIAHTGFAHKRFGVNSVQTVEGNTGGVGPNGDREGDGVYIKIRPKETIHSITRWF